MLQHSVLASRTQQIVCGDDTTQTHQIMQDIAYNAELTRAPVLVSSEDIATFFYPLNDPTQTDLIGYEGVPVGSYPTSTFTVFTAGLIIDPTGLNPNRGTSTFQIGLARTVRCEITRLKATPTGDTTLNSNIITNLSTTVGITIGALITGIGIAFRTFITAIGVGQITISQNATANGIGIEFSIGIKETHYLIDEVDIYKQDGFPSSLIDTSGGVSPPELPLNLT